MWLMLRSRKYMQMNFFMLLGSDKYYLIPWLIIQRVTYFITSDSKFLKKILYIVLIISVQLCLQINK